MKAYDYIIVGAGVGALASAAILSRRGNRVIVLERHSQVGGYASLFSRKGVTFDVSLHQIGGVRTTHVNTILKEAGVYERLTFLKNPYLSELEHPDLEEVLKIPNGDAKQLKQMLIEKYPDEKKGIEGWFSYMEKMGKQIKWWDEKRSNLFKFAFRVYVAPVVAWFLVKSSYIKMPVLDKALKGVKNATLKLILNHLWGYYGLPEDRINLLYPMVANYGYFYDGGYYVQGGGHEICKQFVNVIEENGGDVVTSAEVERILVQNNKAVGVQAKSFKTPIYGNKIICGANPFSVYGKMLQHWEGSQRELQKLSKMELSVSASVLYIALDTKIENLNPQLKDTYEYFHFAKNAENSVKEMYESTVVNRKDFSGDYAQDSVVLSIHSNVDDTSLGESKDMTVLDVFFLDNYDRWDGMDKKEYNKQKQMEIEKMLDRIEPIIPGIREHIHVIELGTPKTMEKFTDNPKGVLYGFSQSLEQSNAKRFSPNSPLKNMHFVSAWSQPGGGYEGSLRCADWVVNATSLKERIIITLLFLCFVYITSFLVSSLIHLLSHIM